MDLKNENDTTEKQEQYSTDERLSPCCNAPLINKLHCYICSHCRTIVEYKYKGAK